MDVIQVLSTCFFSFSASSSSSSKLALPLHSFLPLSFLLEQCAVLVSLVVSFQKRSPPSLEILSAAHYSVAPAFSGALPLQPPVVAAVVSLSVVSVPMYHLQSSELP